MAVSGVIEAHVRARTKQFDAAMKKVSQTVGGVARGMSSAITAVTASAASMEKSWTAVGVNILASFAAGGPIAAGLAAIGAGIGYVIGRSKDLEAAQAKAAEESRKRIEQETKAAQDRAKALDDELDRVRQLARLRGQFGRDPTSSEARIDDAVSSIDALRSRLDVARAAIEAQSRAMDAADPEAIPAMIRVMDRMIQTRERLEESLRRETEDLGKIRDIHERNLEIERRRALERENARIASEREAAIAERIAADAERAAEAERLRAEQIAEGQRNLAGALFSGDSPLGAAAVDWWRDFVAMGESAMQSVSAGTNAVLTFGSGMFADPVDIDMELEELSGTLADVGEAGRSAFVTIGNAIDFAAIRAGDFGRILDNVISQIGSLLVNRAITGIADSVFSPGGSTSGAFGPEDAIPGAARMPIQDFLDRRSALQGVALNVYTPDADSFLRSERQVRLAARRAIG